MGIRDRLARMDDAALERQMRSAMASINQAHQLIATLAAACAQGDNDACEATEEAQKRIGDAQQVAQLIQAEMERRAEEGDEEQSIADKARDGVRGFFEGLVGEIKDLGAAAAGKNKGGGRRTSKAPASRDGEQEALVPQESKVPQWVPLAGAGLGMGVLVAIIARAVRGR